VSKPDFIFFVHRLPWTSPGPQWGSSPQLPLIFTLILSTLFITSQSRVPNSSAFYILPVFMAAVMEFCNAN